MGFAKVSSAQTSLLTAHTISVETDTSRGLYAFSIVGLPDKAVEEAKDRVSAAIKNSGFTSPKSKNHKVVISLAPADLKKEGPTFDVAIALSYLLAAGDIVFDPERKMFVGELSLDGYLKEVRGILPLVRHAQKSGVREIFVPKQNAEEGALIDGIHVYGVRTLRELVEHLNTQTKKERGVAQKEQALLQPQPPTKLAYTKKEGAIDFGDVRGQETAKRGLTIAAAGGHNIALFGPPGTGKTMLARAFTSILPHLSFEETLEVTGIHSIAGALNSALVMDPPFRSPHHTSSYVSVVGGGTTPRPGEVTLAHRGVLFLDEFPEFDRRVIESLREPLEERAITVARAKGTALFPANFILIAALNPCPCGNFGGTKPCVCSPLALDRYQKKISGPIMDRIDMWIEVAHIEHEKLSEKTHRKESDTLRREVEKARTRQHARFAQKAGLLNSAMSVHDLDTYISLDARLQTLLNTAAKRLDLSPRAYHRVMKLARTIADLDEKENIEEAHLLEALQYRPKTHNV